MKRTEKVISELIARTIKITQPEPQREKRLKQMTGVSGAHGTTTKGLTFMLSKSQKENRNWGG